MIENLVHYLTKAYTCLHLFLRHVKLRIDFARHYFYAFGIFSAWSTYRNLRIRQNKLLTLKPPNLDHPVFIRRGTSDVSVFEKIFVWREYDFPFESVIEHVLDCGANTGLAAVWFASQFPDSVIIAIEPDANNYNLLCKNVSAYSNIVPIHAAVWSSLCYVKLENPGVEPDSFRFECCSSDSPDRVRALDIPTICQIHDIDKIDIFKIDIEGGEIEVFSVNCFEWLEKIHALVIEFHGSESRSCVNKAISNFTWKHCIRGEMDCFIKMK